jgi:large conductance mechanosensitive channel
MTLEALKKAGVPVFAYGNFITIAINFILLAFIIFLMIKVMNHWRHHETALPAAPPAPPAPTAPPTNEVLLAEIRDILKDRKISA